MYNSDNVFAKIIRGEIPCNKIYENDYAMSFHDIEPMCATHALIIPKGEYENVLDFVQRAPAAVQAGFWECFAKTAEILGVTADFNILANAGVDAPLFKQSVFHFHLHLMAGDRHDELREMVKCLCE